MSLLAGYDVVIELSNELLRDLIMANLKLSGRGFSPPFEVSVPVAGEKSAALMGPVCLRIIDLQVDLQASRPMSVQLTFDHGSAKTLWGDLVGLDGCIEIPVYFPYVLTKSGSAYIALDLSGIEPCRIAFSEGSKERAKLQLQDAYQGVEEIWQETLAAFIQKLPLLLIATGLTVTASDGGLSPLRFYNIEAQGFGSAQKDRQALGLFGTLLVEHSYDGTPSFKTTSALRAGRLALSISPDVFRRLIFYESVAEAMKKLVAGCRDSRLGNRYFELGSIEAKLDENFVKLNGVLETDIGAIEFCANVILGISIGEVEFSLRNLELIASGPQGRDIEVSLLRSCFGQFAVQCRRR